MPLKNDIVYRRPLARCKAGMPVKMEKLRVLVIDDSAYNRQTIAEILESDPERRGRG